MGWIVAVQVYVAHAEADSDVGDHGVSVEGCSLSGRWMNVV